MLVKVCGGGIKKPPGGGLLSVQCLFFNLVINPFLPDLI